MAPDPSYLKVDEAARFLRVTPRTVYRRIWKGELPASKVGGLYYIKQEDLEAMIEQGRVSPALEVEAGTTTLKCGSCYRLLANDSQIGEVCQTEGCDQLLCIQCVSEGISHCVQHSPSQEQQWERAKERHQRGELSVLVKDNIARLRELNFTNRLQSRISSITTLVHPTSGEVLTLSNWDTYLEQSDERAEVLRLLDKVILDTGTMARAPFNTALRYTVPKQKGQKGPPLEIFVKVLSRLPVMLRDGFDTRPLGADDLTSWLVRLSDEAQRLQAFRLAVLASTTGWDPDARQIIQGVRQGRIEFTGSAFAHRMILFYLWDLETGELLYNQGDERARSYAELFAALLPSEELDEVIKSVEEELVVYDSLTLQHAAQVLPYSRELLEKAFERLAVSGRYVVTDITGLGKVLVRR